jgi:hypothetical protein
MSLTNRDCFRAVSAGVKQLVNRFDWDGVNLAELYFESLEGIGNPSRFTPMNADVRSRFRERHGFDPIEIFGARKDEASQRLFLDFRSDLARQMQEEWLGQVESIRHEKPDLDLVLTHIDDRFDTGMRDALGADAARVLPLLDRRQFTFLVEDPATIWNLGPQRYKTLAERYAALTHHGDKLAIDLNVVDRYQDVYPTKQQTGAELFQLVHQAALGFQRVALYFESSLQGPDLGLLSSSAAVASRISRSGAQTRVEALGCVGVSWKGAALVDGRPWPATDGETVWLPPGVHTLQAGRQRPGPRLVRLNGELKTAKRGDRSVEFSYESAARAIAVLDRRARKLRIDGGEVRLTMAGPLSVLLPRGQHSVVIETE